ncbi:Valine--tRNA ligase [Rhizoctonia solani]|uniref:Valine--tRNA ligase n=1 Tax=Rhizoctonia solani TaxID=456999 RepID=A0A0K6G0S4_9AGAM|nr:Valine--tRNA ligase [Rhizoctonia solani]
MSHRTTTGMSLSNHQTYENGQTELTLTNHSGSTEVSDISSPATNHQDLTGALTPYTPGNFLDSIFSLAWPIDQPRRTSPQLTQPSQLDDDVDQSDDLEEVQAAVIGFLALDPTVESNGLPFVLQGYPLNEFINLPTLFATTHPIFHYYIRMDTLLAMLTVRPMFFRYTVQFTTEAPESLFSRVEGSKSVCRFGISDRLIMMFAYMNGLFEDFGSYVPQHMADELEQDIKRMMPILRVSTEPFLAIGRMVVQQAWFQAALIYLYMGLCGCDSTDRRVVTVRSQFIKLLASTKPRRSIDSFLVLPLVMLGVATESQEERTMIRRRMLGVPECARPGRMGNDFVRILENIWSKRRPIVWSDLRQACWEVIDDDVDQSDDLEEVQSAVIGFLALDPTVESNGLPFVLQGCATWVSYSAFEPLSVAQIARNDIIRTYVMGEKPRQILHLVINTINELVRSAEYDPAESRCFQATEAMFRQRLAEAGSQIESSRGLNQQQANEAMLSINQASARLNPYAIDLSSSKWIWIKYRVDSLSNILGFMQLVAPIFRRACPDPLDGLINLPTLFATTHPIFQQYIRMDAFLAMLTVRPMFFRYTFRFTTEAPESLFSRVEGSNSVCRFGISDRLIMMFAYMNGLFEDVGSYVPQHMTDELEQDIKRMKPVIKVSTEPFLAIGRMVVQQAWFQAALIYLYMGLCGCDSTEARVVTVRSRFIKLLASTKPRRIIDSFLVLPLVMLGVATESQEERNMIRRRMVGVPECARPGRMGNDFVRILENIWSKRCPVVWSDLRRACWEVAGV